ncbi:membrane protein [Corynebacterium phocae]|uniref:Membrane protein n=1 Tax=Corynebacterium phocae TaxID=161895 RepID=A0A1L7D1R9_9CORY|nr:PepSY domain-containing protein [Corynebacterium phocae]APT92079.1 membrane protein [Corynebacterium phocae]KAA8726464.1 PepSY domain-containing protein [Corynebacterium phocae]
MTDVQASTGAKKSGLAPLIRRIHFYAGMFIGPFIIIAALTGALYALAPTMENVVYRDILKVAATDHPVSLEEQVTNAQAQYPDMELAQVWPAAEPQDSTRVLLADPELEGGRLRSIFVNPGTGEVIGDEASYSGLGELPLRKLISEAHHDLYLGPPGELYAELAASWMWFVALGGVFLWLKRVGGKRFFTGRSGSAKASRNWWTNVHGIIGAGLLVAMLGLSVTGLTWAPFSGNNVGKTVEFFGWKSAPVNTALDPAKAAAPASGHEHHHGAAAAEEEVETYTAAELASHVDTVWATAKSEGLTGSLRLFPPKDTDHAWQASERWTPWRMTSDAVSINPATGAVVDRLPFNQLPLFSKLTSWGIYLHMGILFGLPLQILLFFTGIGITALCLIGYVLWFKRGTRAGAIAGVPGPYQPLGTRDKLLVALFLLTVGVYLPVFGVSLAAMLLADWVLSRRVKALATRAHTPKQAASKQAVSEDPELLPTS